MSNLYTNSSDIRNKISPYYYWLMLTPVAMSYAKQFIYEEDDNIDDYLIKHLNQFNHFNVVGGGDFLYLSKALDFGINYTCIEPFIDMYINDSTKAWINYINHNSNIKINFLDQGLDRTSLADLNQNGKKLYFFIFNVISYLLDPMACIHKLKQEGDVFVISCWNIKSKKSMNTREKYFDFLNEHGDLNVQFDNESVLLDLDGLEKEMKTLNIQTKRIVKEITDTLIIEF